MYQPTKAAPMISSAISQCSVFARLPQCVPSLRRAIVLLLGGCFGGGGRRAGAALQFGFDAQLDIVADRAQQLVHAKGAALQLRVGRKADRVLHAVGVAMVLVE